jgi:hypothetical protein
MKSQFQPRRMALISGFFSLRLALLLFGVLPTVYADPNAPTITVAHTSVNNGNSTPSCGQHFQNGLAGTPYLFPQYRYGKPAVLNGNNACPTQVFNVDNNGYNDQSGLGIDPAPDVPDLTGCTQALTFTVGAVWHFNNSLWGGTLLPQPMTSSVWAVNYAGQDQGDISGTLNYAYTLDETLNNPTGWPGTCPYQSPAGVNNNGCADGVTVSVNGTFQILGVPATCSLETIGFELVPSANPCPAVPTNANPSAIFVSGERADNKACLYVKVRPPLAIELASFDAVTEGDYVRALWETHSEIDTLGFNIWRGTSFNDRVKVNTDLIMSQSPGGGGGASYNWLDTTVPGQGSYFYWLEDVAMNGVTTFHGPVEVTFNTPTAVTVSDLESRAIPTGGGILPYVVMGVLVLGVVLNARRIGRT